MPYNVYYHQDPDSEEASEATKNQDTLTEEEYDFLAECDSKGYFI